MHKHIRAIDQTQNDGLPLGLLEIDGEPALLSIEAGKDGTLAFHRQRLATRDVAGISARDFDHVRTKIAEYLGAHRAHLDLREVENTAWSSSIPPRPAARVAKLRK